MAVDVGAPYSLHISAENWLKTDNQTKLRRKTNLHTLPTAEKNSSKSRGRIRAASCMQNTVRASRSSGVSSGDGVLHKKKEFYIVTPQIIQI